MTVQFGKGKYVETTGENHCTTVKLQRILQKMVQYTDM